MKATSARPRPAARPRPSVDTPRAAQRPRGHAAIKHHREGMLSSGRGAAVRGNPESHAATTRHRPLGSGSDDEDAGEPDDHVVDRPRSLRRHEAGGAARAWVAVGVNRLEPGRRGHRRGPPTVPDRRRATARRRLGSPRAAGGEVKLYVDPGRSCVRVRPGPVLGSRMVAVDADVRTSRAAQVPSTASRPPSSASDRAAGATSSGSSTTAPRSRRTARGGRGRRSRGRRSPRARAQPHLDARSAWAPSGRPTSRRRSEDADGGGLVR